MKNLKKEKVLNFINESKKKIFKNQPINEHHEEKTYPLSSKSLESGPKEDFGPEKLGEKVSQLAILKQNIPESAPITRNEELQETIKSIEQIESILNENTEIHKQNFFKNLNQGLDSLDSDFQSQDELSFEEDRDSEHRLQYILKDLKKSDEMASNNYTASESSDLEIGKAANLNIGNEIASSDSHSYQDDFDTNEENDVDTSELIASTNASSHQDQMDKASFEVKKEKSKNDFDISNSVAQKSVDQDHDRKVDRKTAVANSQDGEYSMSFESITDLKNQQFPNDGQTETISHFGSKKEMETFDDSISSISIDDRPSESFIKQDHEMIDSVSSKEDSAPILKSTPNSKKVESLEEQKSATPDNSSPACQSILFQESQLHAIQMANEQTMPIIVQSATQPEQTFLTFAQLLEMNENNEKEIKNEAESKKPILKVPLEEKKMKKAILQKANSKVRALSGKNAKADPAKKTFTKPQAAKPQNTKKMSLTDESLSSPKKNSKANDHVQKSNDGQMKAIDSNVNNVKSSLDKGKSKVAVLTATPSSPQKENGQSSNFVVQFEQATKRIEGNLFQESRPNSPKKYPHQNDQHYEIIIKENASLLQKISELEATSQKLILQLGQERKSGQEKQVDIEAMQQQNRFLENLLQEKELAVPSTEYHQLEPDIQKKLDDQEYLIRGYQTENEKLVIQIKELKKSTKDLEQRHFLKLEAAQRETATLKTQLELSEAALKKASSISNAQATLTIEELRASVSKLEHDLETQKEDAKSQVIKYEALLADANKKVEEALSSHPEHIKKMIADLEEKRAHREKYLLELETKLEWHVGNHDIFNQVQQRIDRYEKTIAQLNKALESQTAHNGKSNQTRSVNDIKKIKQLESQVADLEEHILHSERTLPDLGMETSRPLIANEQAIIYLKKIIHEKENESSKDKLRYEEAIKELNAQIAEKDLAISSFINQEKKIENEIQSTAAEYGKEENKENVILPLGEKIIANQELSDSLSLYKKKALDLENELAQKKIEINDIESKMIKQIHEKEAKLAVALSKLKELESQYHSKIAEIRKANPDVEAVRAELESKNDALAMKLELAQQAHQSIHESTLKLMKSSQEQASRMAFEHSKQSLEILRSELRNEQAVQTAALIESFKRKIYDLESKLAASENPNDLKIQELESKVFSLERELQSITIIHAGCEERLRMSKERSSPSAIELDRLLQKIYDLEAGAKNREIILKQALEKQSNEGELKNISLMKELRLKESQIKKFKTEMDLILRGIQEARHMQ